MRKFTVGEVEGTVIRYNPIRGMFVVEVVEYGEYMVFELLDSVDIELGNIIAGDLRALGSVELRHLQAGRMFSAYGQSGPSSKQAALRLIS
ncbi:hypothetical protein [Lysobacter firmicutimachus]|uniref:Uncharacterized protein n=1 Tax=Lysobacter firmicutimachus TaxID=1792846 RepID=A0ABU8D0L2_9GAMM